MNSTVFRILHKAYGIRFIISVTGTAGKFNLVPLLLTIGSGLGLLTLATLVADFCLLNIATKKKFYQDLKVIDYKSDQVNIKISLLSFIIDSNSEFIFKYFESNRDLFVATNPNLEA